MADISSRKSSLLSLRMYVMIFVGASVMCKSISALEVFTEKTVSLWLHKSHQSIPCDVRLDDGERIAAFSWRRNGSKSVLVSVFFDRKTESENYSLSENRSLVLNRPPTIEDEGLYICKVILYGAHEEHESSSTIRVISAPKELYPVIPECANDSEHDENEEKTCIIKREAGTSLNLTCEMSGFRPFVDLRWMNATQNDLAFYRTLTNNSDGTQSMSLTFEVTASLGRQEFACNVSGEAVSGHRWSVVTVQGVEDDEAPTINCANVTLTTDMGLNISSTVTIDATAYDNVDGDLYVSCSHTSNDTFLVGKTEVNCSAIDSAGNIGTCVFLVTVTANGSPLVVIIVIIVAILLVVFVLLIVVVLVVKCRRKTRSESRKKSNQEQLSKLEQGSDFHQNENNHYTGEPVSVVVEEPPAEARLTEGTQTDIPEPQEDEDRIGTDDIEQSQELLNKDDREDSQSISRGPSQLSSRSDIAHADFGESWVCVHPDEIRKLQYGNDDEGTGVDEPGTSESHPERPGHLRSVFQGFGNLLDTFNNFIRHEA